MLTLPCNCSLCSTQLDKLQAVYGPDRFPLCFRCWLDPHMDGETIDKYEFLAEQYFEVEKERKVWSDYLDDLHEEDSMEEYHKIVWKIEKFEMRLAQLDLWLDEYLKQHPEISFYFEVPSIFDLPFKIWPDPYRGGVKQQTVLKKPVKPPVRKKKAARK